MGHPYPPLTIGSDLIGVVCPGCRQAFARGDVVRALVINRAGDGEELELETAFVHVDCGDRIFAKGGTAV